MSEERTISKRKSDHIQINLEQNVQSGLTTGLEKYRFIHRALPELDLETVDFSTTVFNKPISVPLLISSMTGGTSQAKAINLTLAEAAQETGIAMGVGSQRAAIEHHELEDTFRVRQIAPDILLFANLGAIQLNYHYGIDECQRAVDMIEADALILHLNALQEAVQPGGDTHFAGLLNKIELVCNKLPVPVIAKEVGWGFSEVDIQGLSNAGVTAIDVAGAGGTSWSQVEMYRATDPDLARLAGAFLQWGIPTAEVIVNVRKVAPSMTIFASGGLRSGIDIAKCLALGATLGGTASPFLKTAMSSVDETIQLIRAFAREIQVCMFAAGAADLKALGHDKLIKVN